MTTFEEGLVAFLGADHTLTDMAPGGIAAVKLAQNGTYPAITYFRIGNQQLAQVFSPTGADTIDKGRVQISAWCRQADGGYEATLAIDTQLRTLLDGFSGDLGGCTVPYLKFETAQDLYEDEDRIFHRMMEFSFIALRS